MIDNNYLHDNNLNLKYCYNYKMILKNVMFCVYPTYEDSAYISNQIVGAGQKSYLYSP